MTLLLILAESHNEARLFVEIGASVIVLSILARFASRWGFSAIPLYLLIGLGFECNGDELIKDLRTGLPAGGADLLLNFTPGLVTGLLLKWSPIAAVLLG